MQTLCSCGKVGVNGELEKIGRLVTVRVEPRRDQYHLADWYVWMLAQPAHYETATAAVADQYCCGRDVKALKFFVPRFVVWCVAVRHFGSVRCNISDEQLLLQPREPVRIARRWVFVAIIFGLAGHAVEEDCVGHTVSISNV